MVITNEFIMRHRTERGGWTKFQLNALGLSWPPAENWKESVIGKEISEETARRFVLGAQVRLSRGLVKCSVN